jgi:hypothetical protein
VVIITAQDYMLIFGATVGENKMSDASNIKVMEKYKREYYDPNWDNKVLDYNLNKYNFPTLFLEAAQELFPAIDKLENIHLHLTTHQLVDLRKQLEKMTLGEDFQKLIDSFFEEYADPILPTTEYLIQRTPGIRLMVPDQEKKGRLLSWHTGHHTGYGNGTYFFWTPVTKSFDTNAMQVLSWDDTVIAMEKLHTERLSLQELQELCRKDAFPTTLEIGQSWMFNPGVLHGNFNNDTGVSRVSFDIRAMIKNSDPGFRYPGGFWRLKVNRNTFKIKNIDPNRRWITFSDQGSRFIGSTPQFVIREFLLSWCKKNNITPIEWTNEYLKCDWNPHLQFFIDTNKVDGIVFPSIYGLSMELPQRLDLLKKFIEDGIDLVFVDEDIHANSLAALDYIKELYDYAYTKHTI